MSRADIEPPECPVCLQSYDGDSTTPRVLACGHSACDSCLKHLPQPFTHTIRCPACTQLVKFTHTSALPKNIDLLRFSSSLILQNPHEKDPPRTNDKNQFPPDFIPNLWSQEFYLTWKDWIIPDKDVILELSHEDCFFSVFHGRYSLEGRNEHEKVSLVRIGGFSCDNSNIKLNYSYTAKILWVLHTMRDVESSELGLILSVCSLKQIRVCKVYGLWYDSDDQGLFMVCERYMNYFLESFSDWKNSFIGGNRSNGRLDSANSAMIAMEICEAARVLHSRGLFLGCLGIKCLCFDEFGHVYIDLNEFLVIGRRLNRLIKEAIGDEGNVENSEISLPNDALMTLAFVSPEILFELLQKNGIDIESGSKFEIGYGSDVWSLACVLISLLIGEPFTELMHDYLQLLLSIPRTDADSDYIGVYKGWTDKVRNLLQDNLGSEFVALQEILSECFNIDPESRPVVIDMWKCIRQSFIKPKYDIMVSLAQADKKEKKGVCLFLGELCNLHPKSSKLPEKQLTNALQDKDENGKSDFAQVGEVNRDLVEGLSEGHLKCIDLKGHLDCVTGLAVGGGFLFSSSFDKSVNIWSLQDFNHIYTFKGHKHKVMAIVFVDKEQPLCISGDGGGGIYIWDVCYPFSQEPVKKLYEQKDWRYSGIHSLAVYGTEYLYSGSGDKSIKAWSLQEYKLSCVMNGHKSVVSTLAVCGGVLYSGSWDGTVRLWCLSDHSPLAVLGEDTPGNVTSVLSVAAFEQTLVVAHENGSTKIWRNNVLLKSAQAHSGAIFSTSMEGKWLFTGGWDKVVNVQELTSDEFQSDATPIGSIGCDSVITALLYWQGKLFVGQADRVIKVYYYGS